MSCCSVSLRDFCQNKFFDFFWPCDHYECVCVSIMTKDQINICWRKLTTDFAAHNWVQLYFCTVLVYVHKQTGGSSQDVMAPKTQERKTFGQHACDKRNKYVFFAIFPIKWEKLGQFRIEFMTVWKSLFFKFLLKCFSLSLFWHQDALTNDVWLAALYQD